MRHIQKLTLNKISPSHRSLCPNYYVPTSYVEVKKFKTHLTRDSSKKFKNCAGGASICIFSFTQIILLEMNHRPKLVGHEQES